MKFLHTADWHLGNSMFDIDRTEEFNSFLHWLKETIIKEKIEVLLVAGDIFDTINPPVVSKCQYNDFLATLLNTDCKNVIITPHIGYNTKEAVLRILKGTLENIEHFSKNNLEKIENNTISANETAQNEADATYFGMLKKEDSAINWNDSADSICAKIRAFEPWPGASTAANGNALIIHRATVYKGSGYNTAEAEGKAAGEVLFSDKKEGILIKTGSGILAVQNLQWQTKKAMNWKDFMNGARNFVGSICK